MQTAPLDTDCRRLNPAKWPALSQAAYRARRENKPMRVYVGPPTCAPSFNSSGCNTWFVRPIDEAPPEGTQLFKTYEPEPFLSGLENGSLA